MRVLVVLGVLLAAGMVSTPVSAGGDEWVLQYITQMAGVDYVTEPSPCTSSPSAGVFVDVSFGYTSKSFAIVLRDEVWYTQVSARLCFYNNGDLEKTYTCYTECWPTVPGGATRLQAFILPISGTSLYCGSIGYISIVAHLS